MGEAYVWLVVFGILCLFLTLALGDDDDDDGFGW